MLNILLGTACTAFSGKPDSKPTYGSLNFNPRQILQEMNNSRGCIRVRDGWDTLVHRSDETNGLSPNGRAAVVLLQRALIAISRARVSNHQEPLPLNDPEQLNGFVGVYGDKMAASFAVLQEENNIPAGNSGRRCGSQTIKAVLRELYKLLR